MNYDPELKPIPWLPSDNPFPGRTPLPEVTHLTPLASQVAWHRATGELLPGSKEIKPCN